MIQRWLVLSFGWLSSGVNMLSWSHWSNILDVSVQRHPCILNLRLTLSFLEWLLSGYSCALGSLLVFHLSQCTLQSGLHCLFLYIHCQCMKSWFILSCPLDDLLFFLVDVIILHGWFICATGCIIFSLSSWDKMVLLFATKEAASGSLIIIFVIRNSIPADSKLINIRLLISCYRQWRIEATTGSCNVLISTGAIIIIRLPFAWNIT